MANPSKQKGTTAETELLRLFARDGIILHRTPPGCLWDLEGPWLSSDSETVEVLATRPDRGEWLLTMRYRDVARLLKVSATNVRIESKRYKRFSLHSIFESKFGRAR